MVMVNAETFTRFASLPTNGTNATLSFQKHLIDFQRNSEATPQMPIMELWSFAILPHIFVVTSLTPPVRTKLVKKLKAGTTGTLLFNYAQIPQNALFHVITPMRYMLQITNYTISYPQKGRCAKKKFSGRAQI